ncbi:claspin-like [Maniola jurtina]|uniref:claspin-like n=1 Tax=Maniola jurtina TaxID=191418 RepID=UPI001E6884D7|nr:claspin-like [Maniola jurtina]
MSANYEILMLSSQSQARESFEDVQEETEEGQGSKNLNSSDDEAGLVSCKRKRTMNFSDSESDLEKEINNVEHNIISPSKSEDIVQDRSRPLNSKSKKSRIKHIDTSESENSSLEDKGIQKKSIRAEDKLKKLKDKFKGLISHHTKGSQEVDTHSIEKLPKTDENSENSDEEVSCLKIKQKIKKSAYSMNSICDPDTSDEESNPRPMHKQRSKQHKPRSTKPTSPKPMRMSAKQAMENMHKIKSESNRMLREKQVSLPYHRPKALSLKDIMSKRKPAVTSDGKALPIKMNNEQLKQYVLLLEQRQKEVIELCKSDTEEEEEEDCPEDEASVKNDISTTNVVKEPILEHTNVGHVAKGDVSISNEISCIETDVQENIKTVNIDVEKQASKETESSNMDVVEEYTETDIKDSSRSEKEPRSSIIEAETINEPPNMDIDKKYNETEVKNTSGSEKEQGSVIIETETVNEPPNMDMDEHTETEVRNSAGSEIEQESVMETKTVNEPPNVDVVKELTETDVKNSSISEKDLQSAITPLELSENQPVKVPGRNTEQDSQNMELHYDSEKAGLIQESEQTKDYISEVPSTRKEKERIESPQNDNDEFLDSDFNYDEIDKLIENAKIPNDGVQKLSAPKLMGAPGMVIDLDSTDPLAPKQLTGVDLLKERYTYFAKLKSLEDMEKDREKKFKPGVQHLKLKQELEEQIAEQRSMEWEKRLEEEKRLKSEINDHVSDDDIEKLEAKLEENNEKVDGEEVDNEMFEGEEEPIEDDIILEDKPKKRNPMVDDEAEESECDDEIPGDDNEQDVEMNNGEADDGDEADLEDGDDDDETSDSSSESEEECESKPRKGRILKAFEDSDDESAVVDNQLKNKEVSCEMTENVVNEVASKKIQDTETIKDSQDDELQLAQGNKSSEDLFSTQESDKPNLVVAALTKTSEDNASTDLGTQTFSILDSLGANQTLDLNSQNKTAVCRTQTIGDDLNLLVKMCPGISDNLMTTQNAPPQFSQTQEIGDDVVALCTGKFYDNPFLSLDKPTTFSSPVKLLETSQSQEFGDDVAALCTGKFYDNPFVSQYGDHSDINKSETLKTTQKLKEDKDLVNPNNEKEQKLNCKNVEKTILNSILEELDGPDFEEPKNKYFASDTPSDKIDVGYSQVKKKLVIDSDDETNDGASQKKNKKQKKRKAEERALQISDDEEEEILDEEQSDIESDINEEEERIVEYDSEENEVEVQQKTLKKKRVGAFFENEAELTSEDEWVGSGDEDERGLDRMEREEGDDETFHQGKLQRELGQIHMREVLDQDKREVRMIQELLFEDGDLGDGHRQRKFRWRNADGEEETGTNPDEFLDTQEEEFESEEQWRKQRHEREMFLKKLQDKDEEILDININSTAIVKANLCSRSMSMLLSKSKGDTTEKDGIVVAEKKPAKDIPSPKKAFTIFQQNYHGSLLTRGRGALARLAALATPLATDNDDAPKVVTSINRRNFVFTALSQEEKPKITKRKADTNANTPKQVKKMKTEEPNDKLFPYAEENVKQFLESQWESADVKEVVTALRKLSLEDQEKSVEGHVAIPGEDASKEDQIEGLVNNVKWQMSADRKAGPLKQLQGLIWKQGYDKGDIKGHVYDDVSAALEQWQSIDGQKVYIYSSGSVQAQKLLFGQSLAGDLLKYIEGHFDTAVGAKQEATSYSAIVEKIGCKADDVLFLTDIVKEAEAARTAGLHVALVSREGNAPLPSEATESFNVIHSLGQLASNKRKKDPQEEQPAKVPKTDTSNNVKTTIETETTKPETPVEKKESETEKMEIEEEPPVKQITDETKKQIDDEKTIQEIPEVVVEEVTDIKDDIPVIDVEPVIIECDESKADKIETEKMETEITEKVEETKLHPETNPDEKIESEKLETEKSQTETSVPEKLESKVISDSDKKTEIPERSTVPKEKLEIKEQATIAEETPQTIITEIEEVTDSENLVEMAEIIEDVEPVVEEPNGAEDLELQNVGDVLEKECDEILSKVQDVTNLDNIPLKSTLKPIAEETMETDNLDSNDIMERILDSEMELEKKQSENALKVTESVEDAQTDNATENADRVAENTDKEAVNTDKVVENTDNKAENTEKVAENTDKLVEKTEKGAENTDKPEEGITDVVEENRKGDNDESSITKINSVSGAKETESKIEEEIPPEVPTKESSPQEEKSKPETVSNTEETKKSEESIETPSEQKPEENTLTTKKENDNVTEAQKPTESATGESQVNGDTTNGQKETVNLNGDVSKDEELSSRLSVENGNGKEINGSNGDSLDAENGTDKKVEADVSDIKVKTVTSDEPHPEPIEQPTEA